MFFGSKSGEISGGMESARSYDCRHVLYVGGATLDDSGRDALFESCWRWRR